MLNAHEEYNHVGHRKVEPSSCDAREDEDSDGVLVIVEVPYHLLSFIWGGPAIDGYALDPIEA